MTDDEVIPVLPCGVLGETLDFYRALGFEVTHQQTWPYVYGAVRRGGAQLHFYGGFTRQDPTKAFSTCLVMVQEVEGPHRAFVDSLKQAFGKLPTAGFPRITRLRKGYSRFAVFDPAGNSIIFIARDAPETSYDEEPEQGRSRLAQALDTAVWLRDLKGHDDVKAARVLDVALARDDPATPIERVRALAARAELAVALGEVERARALRAELETIPLSDEERARFRDELAAADDLEQLMK
ncbi:MAG: glyoxalase [Pseudonocardiaceae bacterium]